MQILFLIPEYLVWHYSKALRLHLNIVTNFIWFTYHFFSIPVLTRTLYHPWHSKAIQNAPAESKARVLAETIIVKSLLQTGGPIVRFFVLLFGLVFCGFVAVIGGGLFFLWLVLPIIVLVLFFEGIRLIVP